MGIVTVLLWVGAVAGVATAIRLARNWVTAPRRSTLVVPFIVSGLVFGGAMITEVDHVWTQRWLHGNDQENPLRVDREVSCQRMDHAILHGSLPAPVFDREKNAILLGHDTCRGASEYFNFAIFRDHPSDRHVEAVFTIALIEELKHTDQLDEARCYALQRMDAGARSYRATTEQSHMLQQRYIDSLVSGPDPDFAVPAGCHAGGPLDLDLDGGVFP